METKQCTGCKEFKHFSNYDWSIKKKANGDDYVYHLSKCKPCEKERKRLHAAKKFKSGAYDEYRKKYYSKPESREAIRNWQKRNPEKLRAIVEKYRIKSRDKLNDYYVKACIASNTKGLAFKDITPELVEMKRKQLKLYRNVKENKIK